MYECDRYGFRYDPKTFRRERFYRISQSNWNGMWYVEVRRSNEHTWWPVEGQKYDTREEALEAMKKLEEAEDVAV